LWAAGSQQDVGPNCEQTSQFSDVRVVLIYDLDFVLEMVSFALD